MEGSSSQHSTTLDCQATPTPLLDRFIEVFNRDYTRTVARETYLGDLGVAGMRSQLLALFGDEKHFDPTTQQFKSSLTAGVVQNALQKAMGSVSRCEISN